MVNKYKLNENFLDNLDCQEKAYFLGIMYADGNIYNYKNSYRCSLSQCEKYKDVIYKIKEILDAEQPVYVKKTTGQLQYHLVLYNSHLCRKLIQYGCIPNKSLILRFPKNIPEELMPHFIRGYFDGDGCI